MKADIITFNFEDQLVRTVTIDGNPWFVGKDVCRCLCIVNHRDALAKLSEDERRGVGITDPLGNNPQEAIGISEAGVYRLIFESRKPEAERFKRWVFHDVLPALRKTGVYAMVDLDWDAMREKLALVKQARLTYGRRAAQDLWEQIGLPAVSEPSSSSPVDGMMLHITEFMDEMVVTDPAAEVTASELLRLYQAWAIRNNAPYLTPNAFGKFVLRTGLIRRRKTAGHSVYVGIRVKLEESRHYR